MFALKAKLLTLQVSPQKLSPSCKNAPTRANQMYAYLNTCLWRYANCL